MKDKPGSMSMYEAADIFYNVKIEELTTALQEAETPHKRLEILDKLELAQLKHFQVQRRQEVLGGEKND